MSVITRLQRKLDLIPISDEKSAEQQERLDRLEKSFEAVRNEAFATIRFADELQRRRRRGLG